MATQYLSRELKENEVATSLHKTYSTAHSGGLLGGIKEEGHISTFFVFCRRHLLLHFLYKFV